VAGKISWYQQLDFQSLAMEFSGGKLKQKGFFHSVRMISILVQIILSVRLSFTFTLTKRLSDQCKAVCWSWKKCVELSFTNP
jgi:hypothetical protein